MLNRKERTIDAYLDAGAKLRIAKTVFMDAYMALSKITPAKDGRFLIAIDKSFQSISSIAENHMFEDYPELSDDYLNVFYGATMVDSRSKVDNEILDIMKKYVSELKFGNHKKDKESE